MELFPETVNIKIPCTVTERRKITQCAYNEINNIGILDDFDCDSSSYSKSNLHQEVYTGDNDDVDSIADRLTGLPVFALFVESYRLLKEIDAKKLKEFSFGISNNSSGAEGKIKIEDAEMKSNYNRKIVNKSVGDDTVLDSNNVNNNKRDSERLNNRHSLSFPCVYGQKEAKRAITECLLWPKLYHKLFTALSPGGKRCIIVCGFEYCLQVYHLLIYLFIQLFIYSFVYLFNYLFIRLFIY